VVIPGFSTALGTPPASGKVITVTVRRALVRASYGVAVAVAALGMMAAPSAAAPAVISTASAVRVAPMATSTPSTVQRTIKKWKWYEGGGRCDAQSTAYYDLTAGYLVFQGSAQVSSSVRGCKTQARIVAHTTAGAFPLTLRIPTVCGTADPSCPSNPEAGEAGRGRSFDVQQIPLPGAFLYLSDHLVEGR
jgi:hypothetical protein